MQMGLTSSALEHRLVRTFENLDEKPLVESAEGSTRVKVVKQHRAYHFGCVACPRFVSSTNELFYLKRH